MSTDEQQSDRYREFLAYFARDRDRIFAYIFSLLPRHADAEDVFQRCSLLLWRKFDQFERDGVFSTWACGVAFYEVRNFLRVAGRERLHFDVELIEQLAELRPQVAEGTEEQIEALQLCLQRLADTERQLVQQVYSQQMPIKDLAASSGRAAQTLYNQLNQIRQKLFLCVQRRLALPGVL